MSSDDVVIFGTGQIAELAYFYLSKRTDLSVKAFTVDSEFLTENTFCQRPVVSFEDLRTSSFSPENCKMFVATSYAKLNKIREQKFLEAKRMGYAFTTFIHESAHVCGATVGDNCLVLENVVVQPFAKIGDNVTIWSGSHIGHHSVIADNCFITSHVVISGGVIVGRNCFIGVNATVRDHISIGDSCLIGAGTLLMSDAPDNSLYSPDATSRSRVSSNKVRL